MGVGGKHTLTASGRSFFGGIGCFAHVFLETQPAVAAAAAAPAVGGIVLCPSTADKLYLVRRGFVSLEACVLSCLCRHLIATL